MMTANVFFGHLRRGQGRRDSVSPEGLHGKGLQRRAFRRQRGEALLHRFIQDDDVDAGVGQDELTSGGLRKLLIGTATAPACKMPKRAGMNSGQFLSQRPTLSPGRTPKWVCKRWATQMV